MARITAPDIAGGDWVNVAEPLSVRGLRERVVVLHFFTGSCVTCERVVGELRGIEARSGGDLVLVGVRTPRFDHERGGSALRATVQRLGISHPVVDDPEAVAWDRYGVHAWPTVVVVDRDGYVVGSARGEGVGPAVEQAVAAALAVGPPRPLAPLPRAPLPDPAGELAWPAKVAVHPDGIVLADTGHDRVLIVTLRPAGPGGTTGPAGPGGKEGPVDPGGHTPGAIVAEHRGLRRPTGVRAAADGTVLVCEGGADRVVRIPAGGGRPQVVLDGVASPQDVAVGRGGEVYVAEAGRHRIWRIAADGTPAVIAGTGEEGLEDGYGPVALFAQPSGLAVGAQGLFVVDAESSALRVVDASNRVATLLGRGTATWGDADGPAVTGRLQHPQGVACAPDGYSVYVADTYNSSLRLWSGVDGELRTAPVEGLLAPGGLDVLADGRLVVADTGHHRVVLVDLAAGPVEPLAIG